MNATGATFGANVNPRSLATTVRFEYGTSTSYGSATPDQAIGAGGSAVAVTAAITGLKPGTRYNFRTVRHERRGHRALRQPHLHDLARRRPASPSRPRRSARSGARG